MYVSQMQLDDVGMSFGRMGCTGGYYMCQKLWGDVGMGLGHVLAVIVSDRGVDWSDQNEIVVEDEWQRYGDSCHSRQGLECFQRLVFQAVR